MVDRLRVLYLLEKWLFASGPTSLPKLAKYRNREFFDIEFGAVYDCDPKRAEMVARDGSRMHVFNGDYSALGGFVKSEDIDAVHIVRAGYEMQSTIRAVRSAGVPILVDLNCFGLYGDSPEEAEIDRHLIQSMTAALRYISYGGMSIEEFLQNGAVMYLPVDVDSFDRLRPSKGRRDSIRRELDIEPDAPVICRIGRPDLHKWSFFVLHALSLIAERCPSVRFLVVGGIPSPIRHALSKWRLERCVRVVPQVSDDTLAEVLQSADILAHSSHIGESFGATMPEAMAARKPVVVNSTDWADNAQVELVDHGVTGYVANTPRAYADAILHLIRHRDEAEKMGQAGYDKVLSRFSASVVARSVERIYSELAEAKRIKPSRERAKYYQAVPIVPSIEEIRRWPVAYRRRLSSSGYTVGAFQRAALRKAWMATNLMPWIRRTPFPRAILNSSGFPAYLPALT